MMDVDLSLVLLFTVGLLRVGDCELKQKYLQNLNMYCDKVLDYHLQ